MTSNRQLRTFRRTDQGTAKAFALLWGADLRYCPQSKSWFHWNGLRWEEFLDGDANQVVIETFDRLYAAWEEVQVGSEEFDFRSAALKFYRGGEDRPRLLRVGATASDLPELRINFPQFNSDPWKLGLLNGELDLRTGAFGPARRESYITKTARVNFDPAATCPKWERFISEIFSGDTEIVEVVQRMLGYCLTGSTEEQVMALCVGEGSNGKSTMFNIIRQLMGDYAGLTPFATFSASNKSEQSNDLAMLAGARFVTISESDEDSFLAEAKLKAATGSDPITCRFHYKEFFTYVPQFKIWMGTNHLPGLRGMNHGNFRRQIILHFKETFDGSRRINNLESQLLAEAPGILNWMIVGLRRWHEQKLSTHLPESIKQARQDYREEMDVVGRWLRENWEILDGPEAERYLLTSVELYSDYKEYATSSGHRPKGSRIWTQEMKSKGLETKKVNGGVMRFVGYRRRDVNNWIPETKEEKLYVN